MTVHLMSHAGLLGLSKRLLFAGATIIFLLVYLAFWSSNNHHALSPNIIVASESSTIADNLDWDPKNLDEQVLHCDEQEEKLLNFPKVRNNKLSSSTSPVIYFVTPTYTRPVQIAELTRLGQTLRSVQDIHWIVVEDSDHCSPSIGELLKRQGIPFTHLASSMPSIFRKLPIQPRGVSNRRAALNWIRSNVIEGVLYFGDDDNTYDLRLFQEIRDTQHISMFPVGLIGDYAVSAPVVQDGKVVGFFDSWPAGRRFAVDMAGFAVNIRLLHQYPNATLIYKAGYEEDSFLQGLLPDGRLAIEAKAANCTQILVWHTRTVKVPSVSLHPHLDEKLSDSSMPSLFQALDELNLVTFSDKGKKSSIHYLNNTS